MELPPKIDTIPLLQLAYKVQQELDQNEPAKASKALENLITAINTERNIITEWSNLLFKLANGIN